jgi:hypothetical protein
MRAFALQLVLLLGALVLATAGADDRELRKTYPKVSGGAAPTAPPAPLRATPRALAAHMTSR